MSPSDREPAVPRSAAAVSVLRSPPSTPVPELISPSRTEDEVFTPPHKDTAQVFLEPETNFDPVELKINLPYSGDQEGHAQGKINEILDELIESEKSYVKSLGNVQVCCAGFLIIVAHYATCYAHRFSYTLDGASHTVGRRKLKPDRRRWSLTRSMIICVFCIAVTDKVDNKFSFMQLKSI